MNRILIILISTLSLAQCALGQTLLWEETFTFTNGTTSDNGSTAWTTSYGGGGTFSVQGNLLSGNDLNAVATWTSEWIDISSTGGAVITYDITDGGTNQFEPADYVEVYYRVDGGAETLILQDDDEIDAANNTVQVCGQTAYSGDSIQVIVKMYNTSSQETYRIDNIRVYAATATGLSSGSNKIFSIANNSNWNNGSSWSTTPGGTSCSCTPGASSKVYITPGCTIVLNTNGNANELYVREGAALQYQSSPGRQLDMHNGGTIEVVDGGKIYMAADHDGHKLRFDDAQTYTVTVNEANNGIHVNDIQIDAAATVTFSGTGRVYLEDDFNLEASGITTTIDLDAGWEQVRDLQLNNSNITLNVNDSMIIQDDIDFDNGDDSKIVIGANGYLFVGDDCKCNNNSDDAIIENNGVFDLTNDLGTSQSGADACELYNFANATFLNGHSSNHLNWKIFASYTGNTVNYNRSGNQDYIHTPQDSYYNLTLSGSGRKRTRADLDIDGNVSVEGSATFDPSNGNDDLTVGGNWSRGASASFTQGTRTVTFDGSGNQSINTVGGETFYNVVVNKSANTLSLQSDVTIQGTMTFTNGIVNADATNSLTFNDNATVASASNSSHVNGPVVKIGNDAFTFPIGDGSNYASLGISAPSNVTDQFTVEYENVDPSSVYGFNNYDVGVDHVSTEEYWQLTRDVGSSSVALSLSWAARSGGVTNLSELLVCHYNTGSSMWESVGNVGTTGNTTSGTVTSSSVSSFSPFTLGSSTSNNPLPVELTQFDVALQTKGNLVTWESASELNLAYYDLEHSLNGETFETVYEVAPASPNSNEKKNYSYLHPTIEHGTHYYRLINRDIDGASKVQGIRLIKRNRELSSATDVHLWPIPVRQTLNIENLESSVGHQVQYEIHSTDGRKVQDGICEHGYGIDVKNIPQGYYILHIFDEINSHSLPFVKH
jgi:hypothetical protein